MRRSDLPYHPTSTFVLPRWRMMYVAVNKAACTSLKWLLADLQGENPERFYRSLSSEVSRAMTIHRRALWQHTPMADDLSDEELAAISADDGWFVFAVVRHPTARLFSAWQSKLLLRERWWVERFGDADWFPRVPRSSEDIVEDFHRFVRAMAQEPKLLIPNRHFAPQHRLLAVRRMRYSWVYRTGDLPQLLGDLERHLRAGGWQGEALTLSRANEAPLAPVRALFTGEVLDAALRIYGLDFSAFGFDDPAPDRIEQTDGFPDATVAEIGRLIERSERIGDLSRRARQLRHRPPPSPAPPRAGLVRRIAWRAKRRLLGSRH